VRRCQRQQRKRAPRGRAATAQGEAKRNPGFRTAFENKKPQGGALKLISAHTTRQAEKKTRRFLNGSTKGREGRNLECDFSYPSRPFVLRFNPGLRPFAIGARRLLLPPKREGRESARPFRASGNVREIEIPGLRFASPWAALARPVGAYPAYANVRRAQSSTTDGNLPPLCAFVAFVAFVVQCVSAIIVVQSVFRLVPAWSVSFANASA
jgi:hypothetical protein